MENKRLIRECVTFEKMLAIYCQGWHQTGPALCRDCQELLHYAIERLNRCKFGGQKPVCAKCPIHCYRPDMREKVKDVMRYAGPRMIYRHPVLAIRHVMDGFRREFPGIRKERSMKSDR